MVAQQVISFLRYKDDVHVEQSFRVKEQMLARMKLHW